jgi:hypothetical protein
MGNDTEIQRREEKKRKEAVHLPMRNVRRGEVDEA